MHEHRISYGPQGDSVKLAAHIADCLNLVKARDVRIEGNRVAFKGSLFRLVYKWDCWHHYVLAPFGYGEIEVEPQTDTICYSLSCVPHVVGSTALVAFWVAFVLLLESVGRDGANFKVPQILWFALLWAFLIGKIFFIHIPRFQSFVRYSLETAPQMLANIKDS